MKKLLGVLLLFALGGGAYWYFVMSVPDRIPTPPATSSTLCDPQSAPVTDLPVAKTPFNPAERAKPAEDAKPATSEQAAQKEQPAASDKQVNGASLTGLLFGVLSNVKRSDLPKVSSSQEPAVDTFSGQGVIEIGTTDGTSQRRASNAPDRPAATANSGVRPQPIDIGVPKINETGESRHATSRIAEKEVRRAVGSEK